jgi:hypothetical protein
MKLLNMRTWQQNELVAAHMAIARVSGRLATRVLSTGTESAEGHSRRDRFVSY